MKQAKSIMMLTLVAMMLCSCQGTVRKQPNVNHKAAKRYEHLGDSFYKQQRFTEARREWQLALRLMPESKGLQEKLEQVGLVEEKVQDKNSYAEPLDQANKRIWTELSKAKKYYQLSQLKEAEIAWQTVLSLSHQHAEAIAGLEKLDREQYHEDSEQPFDKMAENLYNEGMAAYRQKDWKQAQMKLLEAEKLLPQQQQIQHYLSEVNQQLRQALSRDRLEELKNEARHARQKNKWKLAVTLWQSLLAIHPDEQEAQREAAYCQQELEKEIKTIYRQASDAYHRQAYVKAIELFSRVLDLDSEHQKARQGLISAQQKNKNRNAGLHDQKQAEKNFEEAMKLYQQDRFDEAMSLFEQAMNLDPDKTDYQKWYRQCQEQVAESQVRKKKQAELCYADGLAAYQRGEIKEALKAWKKTLQLDPGHQKAGRNIKQVEQEQH